VYLAVSSGHDSNSGWTEDAPVKSFGKALEIWEAKCLAESSDKAWIMLTEDITGALASGETFTGTNGLIEFSSSLGLSNINTITLAGSGTGITIDNGTSAGRRVLYIKNFGKTIILKNLTIKGGKGKTTTSGSLYTGGGIYIGENSPVIMEDDVYIEDNVADLYGGGIYVEGINSTFTMKGGEIRNNKAKKNYSNPFTEQGGGVYVGSNGTFIMEGGTIKNNESDIDGGGVYVAGINSTFTMKSGEISGNKSLNASGKGGGVCVEASGNFTMEGGTIKNNESNNDGGGVYVGNTDSVFTMKNGEILNNKVINTSTGKGGGGVRVGAAGTFTMEGGTISKNESVNDGGGVYVGGANSKALIRNGTIGGGETADRNKAQYGAGIYVKDSGRLELGATAADLSYPVIQHNDASGTGGGIVVFDATAIFYHGTVKENKAGSKGGGILIVSTGTLDMQGGTVTGNTAPTGPGLAMEAGSLSMSKFARVNNDSNPIYLEPTGLKITITADFSPQTFPEDIAKITTATGYSSGNTILEDSGSGYISTYHAKFKVWKGGSYQSLSSGGQIP
jgi:hypothetical protein